MRILIDGDSCPVIDETFEVGRAAGVEVILFCTYAHFSPERKGRVVLVDSGFQSVDVVISNTICPEDILVTDDIGLAAIALSKGAASLSSRGGTFEDTTIDQALYQRYLSAKARKAGRRTKGPSKLHLNDRKKFKEALKSLLER